MGAAAGVEMKAPGTLANSMLALQAGEFAAEAGAAEASRIPVFARISPRG